jgi:hypothetical protein
VRAVVFVLALLAPVAHAQYDALAADAATTAGALAAGGVELNPLGWWTVPIRLGILESAKSLPDQDRVMVHHGMNATGYGAAANNLLVFMGSAGAPVFGLMVGLGIWAGGRDEREFFQICARERVYWGNPSMTCAFTPPPYVYTDTQRIGER